MVGGAEGAVVPLGIISTNLSCQFYTAFLETLLTGLLSLFLCVGAHWLRMSLNVKVLG